MPIRDELLKASEERLWHLVSLRMKDGADTVAIDRQIWALFGERWAIMFTDLSGFSRKAEKFGITHFLQVIYRQRELLYPVIRDHGGILVKAEADSLLLLFPDTPTALRCGVAMQRATLRANDRLVDEEKVHLCLGIGVGEVLRISDHDVWGQEVNAASKLGEDIARSGEILVTSAAHAEIRGIADYSLEPISAEAAGSEQNYRVVY